MMMRKDMIPPHVGIKGSINEKFPPLDEVGVCINRSLTPFKARAGGDGKRRVLLNNFNATVSRTVCIRVFHLMSILYLGRQYQHHH